MRVDHDLLLADRSRSDNGTWCLEQLENLRRFQEHSREKAHDIVVVAKCKTHDRPNT